MYQALSVSSSMPCWPVRVNAVGSFSYVALMFAGHNNWLCGARWRGMRPAAVLTLGHEHVRRHLARRQHLAAYIKPNVRKGLAEHLLVSNGVVKYRQPGAKAAGSVPPSCRPTRRQRLDACACRAQRKSEKAERAYRKLEPGRRRPRPVGLRRGEKCRRF